MTIPIKQNTAQIITVGPFLDKGDGVTPEVSLTVTGCHITMTADTADGSAPTLVIDADATASSGDNDLVHITGDNAGYYSLELTTSQTNRVGGGRLCINDDDVHCPVFHELEFLPANVFDARFGADKLQVDVVEWKGHTALEVVEGSPVVTLGATQAAYAPAKAGDKMDIIDAPSSTGVTAIVDAFLTRAFGSVTYTGTTRCVLTALQKLRNKVANVAGTQTVYKENDSDASWTATLGSDADADPVVSIDPDS